MTMHRYREDFEQLSLETSFEEEIARQHLAVGRDANEVVRSASYAAAAAASAARLLAYIAMGALIVALTELVISVVTPDRINSYFAAQPWTALSFTRPLTTRPRSDSAPHDAGVLPHLGDRVVSLSSAPAAWFRPSAPFLSKSLSSTMA
jgi:hypothetical protein